MWGCTNNQDVGLEAATTLKECVIAHWSSDPAPKMSTGLNIYTEAWDASDLYAVVGERRIRGEVSSGSGWWTVIRVRMPE